MTDHSWTKWTYSRHLRHWSRHCVIGLCTAVESVPRGHKPKEVTK